MRQLPPILRFTPEAVAMMVSEYVGRTADVPAEAMPGSARLDSLPPVTIIVSEYDDMRGSGELLARQLDQAGVQHSLHLAEGMLHGHLGRSPSIPAVAETLEIFARAIVAGRRD